MALIGIGKVALLDTNAVLRYILNDIPKQHDKVKEYIRSRPVAVRYEVIAEAVFVLESFYKMPRGDIADVMNKFLSTKNVNSHYPTVLLAALTLYATKKKLDIIDCMLCAFNNINGWDVLTFDKDMNALLKKQ